jgi:Rod binding domain-containing protein
MINMPSVSALQPGTAAPKDDPEKIKQAAGQFEALLIGQLLKSMHDSEGGWLGTGEDQSASSAMEYAQESFAQSLAAKGGLGIATMVTQGLTASQTVRQSTNGTIDKTLSPE